LELRCVDKPRRGLNHWSPSSFLVVQLLYTSGYDSMSGGGFFFAFSSPLECPSQLPGRGSVSRGLRSSSGTDRLSNLLQLIPHVVSEAAASQV
jgi:hypothetical protein